MTAVAGPTQSRLLTVTEAADELNVTERFIRKLIAEGDLDAVRVGARIVRIRRTDLEALLHPVLPPRERGAASR
jgi:excisionase family DNA binding protein